MLDSLITSKMRVQILMRLFLDPQRRTYLRELAQDFRASPGHVRSELQQLAGAGLLSSRREGRQVQYRADASHPLFPELQSMVRKALGMDRIIDSIVERLGEVEAAYVTGDYACGRDTGILDLVLVGDINRDNLADLVVKTERYIKRKIRVLTLTRDEYYGLRETLHGHALLLLWQAGGRS
jgi:DNA-binding transcriptional ArsR family regulator